ncbi:uncharacterized protein G2W53_020875 [Senna tora]|uniref:Uncharacterized protein n=1 Tax=Senna tora TaxID=362788 RepID=A0A834TKX6_9FABA|nr:uncharacterized protein G2W53_020875 [Senna tora]
MGSKYRYRKRSGSGATLRN